MKTIKQIILATLISTFAFNCKNDVKPEIKTVEAITDTKKELDPNATYAKAEFTIDGMMCAIGCAATIEKKIAKMEGVKSAIVDFDKKLAMVEYNEAKVTPASLEETVSGVSDTYKVSNMKTVTDFSTSKICDKACCAGKTDEEKAKCKKACCSETALVDIKACAADCKKACCANKA
ncbi:heavy metal-associated domain-containing protein [Litoribaculum gwangyangense]|uniref:HMA domain-containing protein n=1 Tax=Litoribaculum gwangyangense TaxID=1130722 RepID=A0ABP9C5Z8_9FLAO